MKVVFLKDFEKAITKIKDPKLAQTIQVMLQTAEVASSLTSIPNFKKSKAAKVITPFKKKKPIRWFPILIR